MRKKRIAEELKRMEEFFEDADANQRAIVTPLLQNCAFMRTTLEDLQEIILKEGCVEVYQNGQHQSGVKQSASLQSYNALIKNYSSVIKSILALLPLQKKSAVFDLINWEPREKTPEEWEEERRQEEEKQKRLREEIAKASEYQKRQRELYEHG